MFVRKKKNKSGVISVQVVDKSTGKYRLVKTIGSSKDPTEIKRLFEEGHNFIHHYRGQQTINFANQSFKDAVKQSINSITIKGINLLLGRIYSEIGFDQVKSNLLRQLVLVRLSHPASKLKTTQYLQRYFSISINEDKIYRYLDKLYKEHKEQLQQISFNHTRKILGGSMSVVFKLMTKMRSGNVDFQRKESTKTLKSFLAF